MFDLSQAFVENIYDEDETIAITFINDENELVTEILEAEIDLLETKGIKIGMEVSLEGERFEENDKIILHSIKSLTPYNSRKKFEFRGRIEKIQDGYVYVDGNKVLMAGKGKIKGSGGWEKNNFNSVNDLKLGAWATVKGTRNNGIVNAKNLTTYPNRVRIPK